MHIHLSDGDDVVIVLPDGRKVVLAYNEVDEESDPELDIILPETLTLNTFLPGLAGQHVIEAVQIIIPLPR